MGSDIIIKKGFTSVSLGLLIVMLDLKMGGFDIFLNPAGFALAAYGTYKLRGIEHAKVRKYSKINLRIFGVLFVLSIPLMFYPPFAGAGFNVGYKGGVDLVLGILYIALEYIGITLVCFSVRELASGSLMEKADLVGKLSIAAPIVFLAYMVILSVFQEVAVALLAIPVVIFILGVGAGGIVISWKARYLDQDMESSA
ncbi:MAG: hypothetical protein OIN66_10115 [Candidatus Methanoperedens sp.]|nr:hypothetical protein [Candidatus Methanoperedens sp.]